MHALYYPQTWFKGRFGYQHSNRQFLRVVKLCVESTSSKHTLQSSLVRENTVTAKRASQPCSAWNAQTNSARKQHFFSMLTIFLDARLPRNFSGLTIILPRFYQQTLRTQGSRAERIIVKSTPKTQQPTIIGILLPKPFRQALDKKADRNQKFLCGSKF